MPSSEIARDRAPASSELEREREVVHGLYERLDRTRDAVRVEGTFDNGTRFVTRDYLLFTKGQVVLLSARSPEPGAALAGVIDHMARSAKVK